MAKNRRYYRKADHQPLKEGSSSTIYLETPTIELWNESANADNLVWEGDVVRFKNDTEKRDDLLPAADQLRNRITDAAILDGFEWASVKFPLTLENQSNFSQLYALSKDSLLLYPKKVWAGLTATELNDAQEVQEFYLAGIAHVESCLTDGYNAKQGFRNTNYQDLKQWMDDNQGV